MFNYENVREAIKDLIDVSEAKMVSVDGHEPTAEEMQELFRERIYNLADLLGFEDFYLTLKDNGILPLIEKQG